MAYQRQEEPLVSSFQPAATAYGITVSDLLEINEVSSRSLVVLISPASRPKFDCTLQNKDHSKLEAAGGVQGLAKSLLTSTNGGINATAQGEGSLEHRRLTFGANAFKEVKQKAFWSLLFENLQDPTLILLMAAALVRLLYSKKHAQVLQPRNNLELL